MDKVMVLNGDFRSATSYLFLLYRRKYPGLWLYEPLHPELPYFPRPPEDVPAEVWEDTRKVADRLVKHHQSGWHLPLFEEVKDYLDVVFSLNPAGFKENRLHLCYGEMKRRYKCYIVHVLRNPGAVYLAYLDLGLRKNLFWLEVRFERVRELFPVKVDDDDIFGKFVACWVCTNKVAVKTADRIVWVDRQPWYRYNPQELEMLKKVRRKAKELGLDFFY